MKAKKQQFEDYLALFDKITDNFEMEENIWSPAEVNMAPTDLIVHVNVWRRLIIITYILMSKKGIVPEIPYGSKETLAYTLDYIPKSKVQGDRLFYGYDPSYTRIFDNMLSSYGWEQPKDYTWGIYQCYSDLEENERLRLYIRSILVDIYDQSETEMLYNMDTTYEDLWLASPPELEEFINDNNGICLDDVKNCSEEQQARLHTIYVNYVRSCFELSLEEAYSHTFCTIALHNPKLDIVHGIYKETIDKYVMAADFADRHFQMRADYNEITSLANSVVNGFYFVPTISDVKIEGEKYIYTSVYSYKSVDERYFDELDPFVLAQPSMIFAIILLDIRMDEFIQKWGK